MIGDGLMRCWQQRTWERKELLHKRRFGLGVLVDYYFLATSKVVRTHSQGNFILLHHGEVMPPAPLSDIPLSHITLMMS